MKNNNPIHWSNIDPKHRRFIMLGLVLGMLAACLDGTIVSTCGTIIAADLGGLGLFSWMFTAYMLCETITIPIGGKLSDLYGRKPFFLLGLTLFLGGSIVAGLSTSMEMFIICRAVQGVGGGLLMPVASAAIADLYSPSERGKMQGVMGAVFGLGTALGPVLGGLITDNVSWHWVFYINVPVAAVALFLTARQFPSMEAASHKKIDYLGMSMLGLFLLDLLLFFTWAGKDFEWISYESGLMVAVAAVLLVVFSLIEHRAEDPVIAPRLFKNRVFVCGAFAMLIFGLALTGAMAYLSMFSIFIFGLTSQEAGYMSISMVAGLMITAMLSGRFVQRTGYRPWVITGPVISFIAMVLMSTLGLGDSVWYLAAYMFLLGIGLGCVMAVLMVAVQNSAKPDEMGMTTSSVNLFRAIGGTVATGVFSFLINLRLNDVLRADLPADVYGLVPHDTDVLAYISAMPQYATQILSSFATAMDFAFLVAGVIILLILLVAPFLKGYVVNKEEVLKTPSAKVVEERDARKEPQ
ncbi:MAG: MDR family MFS transporter [Methanomassiliicoccus sp.]|nr:MDR family MFS transporter [Methanomassiliicoccus sp.]